MNLLTAVREKAIAIDGTRAGQSTEEALSNVERLTAMCVLIGSMEQLSTISNLRDDNVFSWQLLRSKFRDQDHPMVRVLDRMMKYPAVAVIPIVRGLAAARLLLGHPSGAERALLTGVITAAGTAMNVRQTYGGDGSDHMSYVGMASAFLARLFPNDTRAQRACLKFLAFQSCASYAVSGAVKVTSPVWRSGRAITGIFRTETYGDSWLYKMTKKHPAVPVIMAWMVILGELSFPLVLVAPKPVARAMLAAGGVFHLANGRFMGLNRFIWAFAGSYPAVAHTSRGLGPTTTTGTDK